MDDGGVSSFTVKGVPRDGLFCLVCVPRIADDSFTFYKTFNYIRQKNQGLS